MHLVTQDTIWTKINPIPYQYPYIDKDLKTDVVIIGGGITGAICAYYFAKEGIPTVLIDKNIIGYGSTSASTSILQYEIDQDLIGLRGLLGKEKAIKAFKLCEKAVKDIENMVNTLEDDCDFRRKECLYYTDKSSEVSYMKKEFQLRKENGFQVEFLDEHEGRKRFSFPFKAGIYSTSGAGEIDPYRFTHGLIKKAIEYGLKVYENTEMMDIKQKDQGIELITTNGFKIHAKKSIMATGFGAKNYFHKRTAILTRSFTVVTHPLENFDGWYHQCIIRDKKSPYTYIRSSGDKRMIIGGEDLDVGGERSKISHLTNEDFVSKEKFENLEQKVLSMFPNIKDIRWDYHFSGFFGETKDNLPFIGEHEDYPHQYFCLGYGSNGILYAILGAQCLRDDYLGKNPEELQLFRVDR